MAEPIGLLGIAILVFIKESGVPVPVPGDLVVVGAGVAAGRGAFDPAVALLAIIGAGLLGGAIQFLLVRGAGRRLLLAGLAQFGVPRERIDRAADSLRRRGAPGVAVARATPGIRIVAIAASAIAALPFGAFLLGLAAGNGAFVAAHFALGLVAGDAAEKVAGSVIGPIGIGLIVLAVVGGAGWWFIRRRSRTAPSLADIGSNWADAACPACLLLGAASSR